ncbi:acetyl-CoA synthetase-like protein [Meredithblackwellia eburnea MCA 4105]
MKPGSVEVQPAEGQPKPTKETLARRNHLTPDSLVSSPDPSITCLADVLSAAVKKFGDKKALGWRDTIRMVPEEKEVTKIVGGKEVKETKQWLFFELSDYKWWTYNEFAQQVRYAASALVQTGHSKDTIFNIYSATTPRWQLMANACASQNITFATAYDSLGSEGLAHSINEPSGYGIFTNASLLSTVAAVVEETPSLRVVIYDGKQEDIKKGSLEKIKAAHDGQVKVYTLDEFLELGKQKDVEPNLPTGDDVACIMYTSGSTGSPKGVQLTNANIISTIAGLEIMLGDILKNQEHYFLAYLPLAHIFEFTVEISMMYLGIPMGYGTVKTLTETSVKNCLGDIKSLRPTILIGVPAVWELIRKGIAAKVKAGGPVKSAVFNFAFGLKKWAGNKGIIAGILDAIVFKAVKEATGGRLKFGVNGGAPLSRDTQEFLSTALVMVIQGFGMTETNALSCILHPDYFTYGPVGVPVPSCEIKLVDFEEAGYHATNNPPQGEIWIRGNSVTKGYYKREDLTKETITEDGWLKTGDIGQWNKDGTLSIIDRVKNLVKLSGGEYIALERLESTYKSCPYVANICVHASSDANRPMAIIFPHEANLKQLVKEKGINVGEHPDFQELCENEAVQKAVLAELGVAGKKAGLKPLEFLQSVVLTSEEWTPQNGLVTAAQKLQRKAILSKFKSEIDAKYP